MSAGEPEPTRPRRVRERQATPPRRILIADHGTRPLPDLATPLAAAGHTVLHSPDVLSTLRCIEERRPDLVLLAPLSRNLGGEELQRVIAARRTSPHTTLLVLAEAPPPRDVLKLLAGNVDDVVPADGAAADPILDRVHLALGRLERILRLELERATLERQSITDFKTELFNDRHFHARLDEEYTRAARHHQPVSCVMLDFDDFKGINDRADHVFGDFVLRAFAHKLKSVIRSIDIAARLGGDEFALLLPNTGLDEAVRIAERVRCAAEDAVFEQAGRTARISLSIGISTFDGVEHSSPDEFLRRADCALLEAKRRGKARTVLYPQIAQHEKAPDAAREAPAEARPPA